MTTPAINISSTPAGPAPAQAAQENKLRAARSTSNDAAGKTPRALQPAFAGLPKKDAVKEGASLSSVAFSASKAASAKAAQANAAQASAKAVTADKRLAAEREGLQLERDAARIGLLEMEYELITKAGKRFNHDEFKYAREPLPVAQHNQRRMVKDPGSVQ